MYFKRLANILKYLHIDLYKVKCSKVYWQLPSFMICGNWLYVWLPSCFGYQWYIILKGKD